MVDYQRQQGSVNASFNDEDDWDSADAGISASRRKLEEKLNTTPPRILNTSGKSSPKATIVSTTPNTEASTPSTPSRRRKTIPASYISIITSTYGVSADLYALLQVTRTSTARDIRISYFRRGRQVLTDSGIGNGAVQPTSATVGGVSEQAKMRFQAVSMAYEILSDEEMRATYDAYGLQAHSEDDAFVDYYADAKRGTNSPMAAIKGSIIKPTERVRSGVRWNEEVEELVFEKDKYEMDRSLNDSIQALSGSDDSSDDGSQRRRMRKGRRKKKRTKKKKIVVVDSEELNRHLEQLDDEYDVAKANDKDYMNEFLDDLETSIDGLLNWNSKAKGNDKKKKNKNDYESDPTDDSSIEAVVPRQRQAPPPRSSKIAKSSPLRNKERSTSPIIQNLSTIDKEEFMPVQLPPKPIIQDAQPRKMNDKTIETTSKSDSLSETKNSIVDQEAIDKGCTVTANQQDNNTVSAMSQNAFNRAVPSTDFKVLDTSQEVECVSIKEEEEEVPMDEPALRSNSSRRQEDNAKTKVTNLTQDDSTMGGLSTVSIGTNEVGNCNKLCGMGYDNGPDDEDLEFAANWLLAGDSKKDTSSVLKEELSRELNDSSILSSVVSTEKEEQHKPEEEKKDENENVTDVDNMSDFAAYLYNYLKAITDEVAKCATAVASSDVFDGTRNAFQSLAVSDDDLSNMLGILKREMDRTTIS